MSHWIRRGFGGRFGRGYDEFKGSHQMEANVSSGHGVVNPGPSLPIQGFHSPAVDEMLNLHDADGTSTAQYTPAVHTFEAKLGTGNGELKPGFYREGTIFLLEGKDANQSGDSCGVKVWKSGSAHTGDLGRKWTLVLAADVDATIVSRRKVYMPFATRGVQTVDLSTVAQTRRTKIKAGSDVYLDWSVDNGTLHFQIHVPETVSELRHHRDTCVYLGVATLQCQRLDSSVSLCLL